MAKLEPVQLDIVTKSDGKGMQTAEKGLEGLGGTLQKIGTIAAGIGLANIGSQMVGNLKQFLGDASQEASNFQKAMTTLDIIAGRFGESGEKAQQSAASLGKELRIGTGPAAEGLQNLLKSGLDLDTAGELMKRFTNEAMTGKSPTISLGQAVQNLSFAYATNNSALGNLSGVSENFSDIIKKGEEALLKEGVAAEDITEDMAKLKGMMDLTNLTMGSAERFTGTLVDKQAQLDQKMTELKVTIGTGINTVMATFLGFLMDSGVLDGFANAVKGIAEKMQFLAGAIQLLVTGDFNKAISEMMGGIDEDNPMLNSLFALRDFIVENQELIKAFTLGTIVPMTVAFLVGLAPAIWGAVTAVYAFVAGMLIALAPFVLIGAAVAALYWAWENNFLGIRDIVNGFVDWFLNHVWPSIQTVFNFIGAILTTTWQIFQNVWNLLIKPLLSAFVQFLKNTFWTPIENVFKLMTSALEAMGLTWGDVWEGIKSTVFGILGAIVNQVKNRINDVINIINGLINGANAIGDKVPGYTRINTIPNLANGTDNFKGGLARVGEQGPETVYLPPGSQVAPYNASGSGQRPIEVTQIINSGIDMDFAFRELAYVLRTS